MANNVYTYTSFENMSEEASDFLLKMGELGLENSNEGVCMVYDIPYNDPSTEDKINYDWWIENVGAKWMTFEDISDNSLFTVSAWSSPIAFYDGLFEKLKSLNSPELLMWCRYDDEMPNFVGVYGRYKNTDYDECVEDGYYKDCIGDVPYNTITDAEGQEDCEWSDTWDDNLGTFYEKEYGFFQVMIEEYND